MHTESVTNMPAQRLPDQNEMSYLSGAAIGALVSRSMVQAGLASHPAVIANMVPISL